MNRPPYTRRTVFVLPLTANVDVKMSMVWPLTRAEWSRLHELLAAMEPALVTDDETGGESA
jgi:hypothetical protein